MTFLLDVAVRSSLLLFGGSLAVLLLRHYSPALRHAVLAATIFASATVLPLGWMVPAWTTTAVTDIAHALPQVPAAAAPVAVTVTAGGGTDGAEPWRWAALIWAAGSIVAAAALVTRILRLRHATARGTRVSDGRCEAILARVSHRYGLRRAVALVETDREDVIATWGMMRPCVLLPRQAARTWSDDRLHAVLCHELAHVRRHDWIVQMGAEAVRALYWFNPLFTIACGQVRRESELACDDEVLNAGVAAPDYAGHLLTLAQSCRRGRAWAAAAIPMARPSTLERRIAAMLTARSDRRALSRRGLLVTTLLIAAAAVPIAALRAAQTSPLPLTGAIYDPSGAVLPGVDVTLVDAQEFKWEATTDASGHFDFPPVQPGRYILEAKLAGFRELRTEFDLATARDWNRAITMSVGDLKETVKVSAQRTAKPPSSARPTPVRVGGNIKAPMKVNHANPVYPASMREAGLSGIVPIEALIGVDGSVVSARVQGAHVHPDFAAAALDAVRQWVFTPTLLNGRPVEVVMNVSVQFELQ